MMNTRPITRTTTTLGLGLGGGVGGGGYKSKSIITPLQMMMMNRQFSSTPPVFAKLKKKVVPKYDRRVSMYPPSHPIPFLPQIHTHTHIPKSFNTNN